MTQVVISSVLPTLDVGGPALLLVPACCAGISALVLVLRSALVTALRKRDRSSSDPKAAAPAIGKGIILGYRVARFLGCFGLLALSVVSMDKKREDAEGTRMVWGLLIAGPYVSLPRCPQNFSYFGIQAYASILAALSLSPTHPRNGIIRHVNCVLFTTFCVYAYRDIFPLATFTRQPEDLEEGRALWAKIGLLFLSGVVVPLFTPSQYIPVDPLVSYWTPCEICT
jgi:hypothetical protein